jgi:hypothetical protein
MVRTAWPYGYKQGHPFDLTKVRLQTAPAGTYTGALDVVKKTLARDGVKGLVLIDYAYILCSAFD